MRFPGGDAPEIDRAIAGRDAKQLAGVPGNHVAIGGDPITLRERLRHLDLQIGVRYRLLRQWPQ